MSYLLKPLGIVLHDVLQLLDLLTGEVRLGWRGVPLQCVGIVRRARLGLPASRTPGAPLTLRQDEGVRALAVLDPVEAPAIATFPPTSCAAAAAAAAATTAATATATATFAHRRPGGAVRASLLLGPTAAGYHQKGSQGEERAR